MSGAPISSPRIHTDQHSLRNLERWWFHHDRNVRKKEHYWRWVPKERLDDKSKQRCHVTARPWSYEHQRFSSRNFIYSIQHSIDWHEQRNGRREQGLGGTCIWAPNIFSVHVTISCVTCTVWTVFWHENEGIPGDQRYCIQNISQWETFCGGASGVRSYVSRSNESISIKSQSWARSSISLQNRSAATKEDRMSPQLSMAMRWTPVRQKATQSPNQSRKMEKIPGIKLNATTNCAMWYLSS